MQSDTMLEFQDCLKDGSNSDLLTSTDLFTFGAIRFYEHLMGRRLGKIPIIQKSITGLYEKQRLRIQKRMDNCEPGRFGSITTLTDISPEEFRSEYMHGSKPFVIRGVAKDWECVKKWSPQFFAENYGDDRVNLINDHIATDESVEEECSMREIIESFNSDDPKYCRFLPILDNHPELYEHFDTSWLADRMDKGGKVTLWGNDGNGAQLRSHLFIGREGMKTEVHCALTNNFFINVHGRKKWFIFSPKYNQFIDSPINWGPGVYGSEVDVNMRNDPDHPLWKYVDGYEFIMEPGDILYNPPFWWHRVSNLTDNVSIGLRWFDLKSAMKASTSQSMLALMATNPTMMTAVKNAVDYGKTHGTKKRQDLR
jgi:hypothetical protein